MHNQKRQASVNTICADIENNIEEGAKNLKLLASKIDTTKMKAPSFLMMLTGTTRYAIRREDGVYVVPVGCLVISRLFW